MIRTTDLSWICGEEGFQQRAPSASDCSRVCSRWTTLASPQSMPSALARSLWARWPIRMTCSHGPRHHSAGTAPQPHMVQGTTAQVQHKWNVSSHAPLPPMRWMFVLPVMSACSKMCWGQGPINVLGPRANHGYSFEDSRCSPADNVTLLPTSFPAKEKVERGEEITPDLLRPEAMDQSMPTTLIAIKGEPCHHYLCNYPWKSPLKQAVLLPLNLFLLEHVQMDPFLNELFGTQVALATDILYTPIPRCAGNRRVAEKVVWRKPGRFFLSFPSNLKPGASLLTLKPQGVVTMRAYQAAQMTEYLHFELRSASVNDQAFSLDICAACDLTYMPCPPFHETS
eukprot:1141032-Pelagomonas_calceolata.AAC.4